MAYIQPHPGELIRCTLWGGGGEANKEVGAKEHVVLGKDTLESNINLLSAGLAPITIKIDFIIVLVMALKLRTMISGFFLLFVAWGTGVVASNWLEHDSTHASSSQPPSHSPPFSPH